MYFLYVGEKSVKSRKGNDTKNLQRTKKHGAVLQRKLKTKSKLKEKFA
jgi:hypothetical protein